MEILKNNSQHDAIGTYIQKVVYKGKGRERKLKNFISRMELKNIII